MPGDATERIMRVLRSPRFARFASVLAFFLVWQLLIPLLPTELIPTPAEVLRFMWDEIRGITVARTTVWQAFWISLRRLGIGFALAFAIGVPVGLLMGASRSVENFLHDFVIVGLAMPSLVWALLSGIWFGLGDLAPIFTVLMAAIPFVIINTFEGVRDIPKDLSDMARAYETPRMRTVRHLMLPSLMPFFFASLRYGLANGWKGVVLAEVFASTAGAGWNIQFWRDAHRAQGVFGYALFFIIFALLMERLVFQRLAKRVFRWRPSLDPGAAPTEVIGEEDVVDEFLDTEVVEGRR